MDTRVLLGTYSSRPRIEEPWQSDTFRPYFPRMYPCESIQASRCPRSYFFLVGNGPPPPPAPDSSHQEIATAWREGITRLRERGVTGKILIVNNPTPKGVTVRERRHGTYYGGIIVNRTYGTNNNYVFISLFLRSIFGPIYYAPP